MTKRRKFVMQLRGRKQAVTAGGAVLAMALLAACSSSSSTTSAGGGTSPTAGGGATSSSAAAGSGTLNGSGSSFQNTFQQAAISAFKSVNSGITVNYASVGSGTGRSNLAAGTVNFAGSDSPIPAKDQANF